MGISHCSVISSGRSQQRDINTHSFVLESELTQRKFIVTIHLDMTVATLIHPHRICWQVRLPSIWWDQVDSLSFSCHTTHAHSHRECETLKSSFQLSLVSITQKYFFVVESFADSISFISVLRLLWKRKVGQNKSLRED
jgi:hypothetical protein